MSLTKDDMADLMERVIFGELRALRSAGQAEYAHGEDNAFGNFERTAAELGISREMVLLVFLKKHLDGIASWVKGHKSQREDVRGRINDAMVYLAILRGMVEDRQRYDCPGCESDFAPFQINDLGLCAPCAESRRDLLKPMCLVCGKRTPREELNSDDECKACVAASLEEADKHD